MKTLLITATLAIFSVGAIAQTPQGTQQQQRQGTQQSDRQDQVRIKTERMVKDFDLNDNQKKRLNELNTKHHRDQVKMYRENSDRQKMQQDGKKFSEDYDRQIKSILTDEQYKKYERNKDNYTWKQEDIQRDGDRQGGQQGQPGQRNQQPNQR